MTHASAQPRRLPDVRLIPARPEHAPLLLAWRSDPQAQAMNPYQLLGERDLAQKLSRCGGTLTDEASRDCRWIILCGKEPVGTVSAKPSWMMRHAEIGYQVAPLRQGQGIGRAAVSRLCDHAFRESRMERLFALIHHANDRSCRLAAALGFQREGVLRQHYLIQGKRVDEVVWGILRNEWLARPDRDSAPLAYGSHQPVAADGGEP